MTPHVVSYSAHLDSFFIRGVKPRREGRREGQPLSPSLPPGVDSSDAKMSKKEHCMTPKPGSKVTPQLGSYICSFLVNYTSETSTTGLAATVAASLEATWRRFFWLMVAPWYRYTNDTNTKTSCALIGEIAVKGCRIENLLMHVKKEVSVNSGGKAESQLFRSDRH